MSNASAASYQDNTVAANTGIYVYRSGIDILR